MKNTIITAVLVLLLVVVSLAVFRFISGGKSDLISPLLSKPVSTAVPESSPSYNLPQEVKYGSSTDLKQELESINPQVLDSDFE